MLFAGCEIRIVKICDQGLENAAGGPRPRVAKNQSDCRIRYCALLEKNKP